MKYKNKNKRFTTNPTYTKKVYFYVSVVTKRTSFSLRGGLSVSKDFHWYYFCKEQKQ